MPLRQFTGPHAFAAFAAHIRRVAAAVPHEEEKALERIGVRVAARARAKYGEYQDAFEPPGGADAFPEWAALADSTVAEKERLGYGPPDNPVLRTGETRDSVTHTVGGTHNAERVTVGSPSIVAKAQEFGTEFIPPRPAIGAAMAEEMPANLKDLKRAVADAFEKI
jgi:hypothetical protein